MQLRKLIVYGKLRKLLGRSHFNIAVNNPAQAFSFLKNNFPQIEGHILNNFYRVKMGETEITEKTLLLKGQGDIKIIPLAVGARSLKRVLIGVAVVAGAAVLAGTGIGVGIVAAKIATSIGVSMIVDGVTSMIVPPPKKQNFNSSDMSDNDPSMQVNFGFS